MKYLIFIITFLLIISCSNKFEKDRKELVFSCTDLENSFLSGEFNDESFCYSENMGYESQFLSSASVITESNTLEIGTNAKIGDAIYNKLWQATIDINNALPFEHYITIKSPSVLIQDSLKRRILQSLESETNLLTKGYSVEFTYVDDDLWTEGAGNSIWIFLTKESSFSDLHIENLDTVSVNNSAITLDIEFRFNVDLFDPNDNYFGTLSNCKFNTTFKL